MEKFIKNIDKNSKKSVIISSIFVIIGYIYAFYQVNSLSKSLIYISPDGELLPVKLVSIIIMLMPIGYLFFSAIATTSFGIKDKKENLMPTIIHFLFVFLPIIYFIIMYYEKNILILVLNLLLVIFFIFNYKFIAVKIKIIK